MKTTLGDIAALVSGTITKGSAETAITGFGALDEACARDISFFGNERYQSALEKSQAGAVLIPEGYDRLPEGIPAAITVTNPSAAFAEIVGAHGAKPRVPEPGIHPAANVHPTAKIGEGTEVGPGCFVGEDAIVGKDCLLHANAVVRERCIVGDRAILHSGCVVGSDGFGYEPDENGVFQKIPQIGNVELGVDVEVGANSTLDRARFGRTYIGDRTKIDNLVQIGHNCTVGTDCAFAAHVALAGSVTMGDRIIVAGQCAFQGHITVCSDTLFHARCGVTKSVTEPGHYMGYPSGKAGSGRKVMALTQKLPEIYNRLRALEKSIKGQASK